MRTFSRSIAIIGLTLFCAGCAAEAGSTAGAVVGRTAWVAMKGGGLMWKGGSFAVKTTGRTVVGAARGIHEEFSSPETKAKEEAARAAKLKAQPSQVASLSE
jgi:hypothetical protein